MVGEREVRVAWKIMEIGRDDQCAGCGVHLPAGSTAVWFSGEQRVRCVECAATYTDPDADGGAAQPSAVPPPAPLGALADLALPALPPAVPLRGMGSNPDAPTGEASTLESAAGASAQREYERRSQRELARKQKEVEEDAQWRQAVKEKHPFLGRIAVATTPRPTIGPESQSTTAWKTGAEGERRVAEVLAAVPGVQVLHDVGMPGTDNANIDHIAVGPAGVYVIDAKKYSGAIELRDLGRGLRTDHRLYVNNRDRTPLADGVLAQMAAVRGVLGPAFAEVPIWGVLCFIGAEWSRPMRPKIVNGVTALWPVKLTEHVSTAGNFSAVVPIVADHLRTVLRPAG